MHLNIAGSLLNLPSQSWLYPPQLTPRWRREWEDRRLHPANKVNWIVRKAGQANRYYWLSSERKLTCESVNCPWAFFTKLLFSLSLNGSELKMLNPVDVTATKQPKSWLKLANRRPQLDSHNESSMFECDVFHLFDVWSHIAVDGEDVNGQPKTRLYNNGNTSRNTADRKRIGRRCLGFPHMKDSWFRVEQRFEALKNWKGVGLDWIALKQMHRRRRLWGAERQNSINACHLNLGCQVLLKKSKSCWRCSFLAEMACWSWSMSF